MTVDQRSTFRIGWLAALVVYFGALALLLSGSETSVPSSPPSIWELQEEALRPQDIVEELLIMAMPFSAMHDTIADCKAFELAELSAEANDEKVLRPFASLRMQMKQNEKDPDE